jgi:serine/threonine protein phosphatase 1
MDKHFFIIGDVHGCLKTLEEVISHWDHEREILIQLGDLIDRGAYSPQTVRYCIELERRHPDSVKFLRGNHEQMLLDFYNDISTSWLANGGRDTLHQFVKADLEIREFLPWIDKRHFYYETDHVFISHAGLAKELNKAIDPRDPNGLLWNRAQLKNINKTQVIGHTPLNNGKPSYSAASNSWNIDTGAYKGICLTGLKLDHRGAYIETISVPTKEEDLL